MKPLVTMRQALEDPALLGKALSGESWLSWRALLIAMMGEALTGDERVLFKALTGRDCEPLEIVDEFWGVIGRRGGKTRAMAVLAAYLAALVDHTDQLVVGERGVVVLLAATTAQAQTAFNYIAGLFNDTPMLAEQIANETADTLSLSNSIDIQVRAANFRTARGMTAIAVIGDEAAFWRSDDSANPDTEILNALRPALATTGGLLAVISSPYARRGELYNTWKRHFGPDGDRLILVAHGGSRTLNPSLPQKVVDREMERDPAHATAEYLAQFRTDVEALLSREAVDAVTVPGRFELPPRAGVPYLAFTDPSGGSADSFTLAVCHLEGNVAVLDALRERKPPFSPEAVVVEFAELLKTYRVSTVSGDKYAGEWPRERFRLHGIDYEIADRTASDYYRDALPLINSGRVELLEHSRLNTQLVALERRTSRTGKDLISHPPGGHDDLANAVCGVLVLAAAGQGLGFSAEFAAELRTLTARSPYAQRALARHFGRR